MSSFIVIDCQPLNHVTSMPEPLTYTHTLHWLGHKKSTSYYQEGQCGTRKQPVRRPLVAFDVEGRAMNVEATWSFSADRHVFKLRCNPGGISWVNHGIKLKTIIDLCICWPKTPGEITRGREPMMDRPAPLTRAACEVGVEFNWREICLPEERECLKTECESKKKSINH